MNFEGIHLVLLAVTSLVSAVCGYLLRNKKTNLDEFQEEFKRLQARVEFLEKKNYELMEKLSDVLSENAVLRTKLEMNDKRGDK